MNRVAGIALLAAALAPAPMLRGAEAMHKTKPRPTPVAVDPACKGFTYYGPPCDRHARSGYGLTVAPWARWTYDCNYLSYYVGGSARPRTWEPRVRPEPRYPWEGVWGTDYSPCLTATELWWTHGRLYQDGSGQYEPDRRNVPFFLKFGK